MKKKLDVRVGVIQKVREYYVTHTKLAGLIKVDRVEDVEKFGNEIHVYYENAHKYDEFYVNGVRFVPQEREKQS